MKKTLITLLALSGLAMAESNLLWTATKDNGTWDIVKTEALPANTDITFSGNTFTGTGDKYIGMALKDEFSVILTLNCTKTSVGTGYQKLVDMLKTDGYTFGLGVSANKEGKMDFSIGSASKNRQAIAGLEEGTQYITLTMSNDDGAGNDGYLKAYVNGVLAATETMNKNWRNDVSNVYVNRLSISEAFGPISKIEVYSGVVTPAVPEPATATLSLLALAGLAARRRRH